MAKNIGIISGRVELDSVDFTKNLAAMKRELRTLKTDTELAKRGFDVFGDGVTGSAGVMKTFEDQIKVGAGQMKRYSDDFNKAMKENDGQLTRASQNAQRNFKRMQLEVSKAAEEYYNYALQEERANNAMYQGAARMVETGDRWKKTGKSIEDFGQSWTRAGVAVGLGVAAVTKTAIDFESGVTEMAKTIDVSDEKFAELTQGVRELALEIPIAASELAGLAAIAGQFGIHEDSILSFTETVAGLEVATDMTAESAGMMIAQFAQITAMDHGNFDRLGSSVVELGNNLPTTEKAIMDMAMGLAGAGNTAGMTESEIIGLAGGLSSLGISSERGASSFSKLIVQMAVASATGVDAMASLEAQTGMTRRELELMASNNSKGFKELAQSLGMTTSEMNDAIKASIDLEGYASVAGLTIEEFARAFKEDAVGAIGLFVDGLAQGNDETGTAIEILDELGITEIRLRDTLLRTGNAQGVLNDAVRSSNEAWEENVALANEADLFYNNTASQLTILGNKMKDVAIELGTALLPVLNDFIDGLDPLINGIKGAATWFTNLDEGTQKLIASATGLFIIGGPIVSLIGKTVGGVGTLTSGAGKLAMKLLDVGNQSRAAKRTGEMLHRTLGDLIGEYGFGGLSKQLDAGVSGTKLFGGSMATAAGTKGAGAMTGALSALSPWLVGLVGAGGLLVLGYGAWKLWGEEAYEAGERTRKWGTDVGEATEGVLGDIENTLGTFNLLQQGVSADSALMVGDFQKMGQAIEDDINRRLLLTEEYISGLPEVLGNTVNEILGDYQEGLRETSEVIKANNEEIARIQQQASEENRELNAQELAYINELQRYSTDEYISILDITAEEEKTIRRALSGDVENITKEQTLRLIAMLNEENKAVEANRQADLEQTRAYLDERNLLNTAAGDEILQAVNDYYDAMGVSGQRTMQELYNLYPELAKTHDLATGNMLSTNEQARKKQLASNALLVESWEESHRDMGKASEDLAKAQELIVDSTRAGAETWNRLVAESGGNMDVFREKVMETTKTAEGWNHIRFQIHEANLESDALLVIGEAAIANGWWDGMAWEDKQAILQDNFSDTVYQAIVDEGTWDKLSWEEQIAVLNNGFSDGVVQAIIDEGKWDDLPWEQKKAILTTNSPETLQQILEDIGVWNTLPIKVRKLLADNSAVFSAVNNAQRKINSLRGKSVTLQTVHESVYTSINRAGSSASSQRAAQSGYTFGYAQGTDYHAGGAAILGDGGRREPFLTPQGAFGVSPDVDTMYDLPRGTKVWSSIQNFTSQLKSGANKIANIQVPKFATGTIDFPNMQELLQPFSVPQTTGQSSVDQSSNDTYNIYITAQGNLPDSMIREMAVKIEREIKKKQDRKRGSRGERVSFG